MPAACPEPPLRVYIGWDSREEIAYEVAKHTLLKHATVPVEVIPIKKQELEALGVFHRPHDPLQSTEFTYTRFLVPHLTEYRGWALFVDCDFLFRCDIKDLFAHCDPAYAVLCAQHDYRPRNTVKMDGAAQTVYPRKNWSSCVLFNCGHPANAKLTPEVVNSETGAYLHRFQWLTDDLVGAFSYKYNYLEGWYNVETDGEPEIIHYTNGGPWFDNCQDVDFAKEWCEARDEVQAAAAAAAKE
jgi:lipopolysaccharide biosynthesis glycosyltransferase